MQKSGFLLLFLFAVLPLYETIGQQPDSIELKTLEDRISGLFSQMNEASSDKDKELINTEINGLFEEAMDIESSFRYPFDSLKHVGKIITSDKKLRIYTWNLPYNNGTHKYSGYLQYNPGKNEKQLVFRLIDKSEYITSPETKILQPEDWFGALYYDVVTTKYKGLVYYTLLGFDFNDIFSAKKIVDILYFIDEYQPRFGKPVFEYENRTLCRIIFEYSARASMSLRYNKEMDLIVYDHLSPSRPSYEGKFQFYGPDFSYDALKFEDGFWKVVKDIDIRNPMY